MHLNKPNSTDDQQEIADAITGHEIWAVDLGEPEAGDWLVIHIKGVGRLYVDSPTLYED